MTVPEITYTIVLIVAIVILLTLYILGLRRSLEAAPAGRWAVIPALTLGFLLGVYLVLNVREIDPADWAQIMLLFGLVMVTGVYAMSTARQAEASAKMADEMKEQRVMASRPVIIQKAERERNIDGIIVSEYFSHFEVYNAGNGPAIELVISLMNSEKHSIHSQRKSFLRAGELPIEFYPSELARQEKAAIYYLVCEYQSISFNITEPKWYQTWFPFELVESSREDKVYIIPGELEFKEVTEADRIDAFSSMRKPK